MKRSVLLFIATWVFFGCGLATSAAEHPNIVFIIADDIGYGDLGCYGATQVKTPHCDRLAREGLRFTDAHSTASTCTPTRYSFMTGEYHWRKQGTGILRGIDGLIIEPGRTTVPSLLQRAGYTTGVVGKWHLGLGTTPTDFNGDITPGPLDVGFDYAWIFPATGDRTPCVWIENRRVVNLDPADPIKLDYSVQRGDQRSWVAGIPRIGSQEGGTAALWKDSEKADVIAAKGSAFIEKCAATGKPFFLYLATHDIHVPRVPHDRFRTQSQAGIRGDCILSFDWTVGQIIATLEKLKVLDNTLIIVTSDNGGVLDTNGPDSMNSGTVETNRGHRYNGVLRGEKGTPFEGGTRLPFIVRLPGHVPVGESDALICQIDMLATFAALTGQTLADNDAPDSENMLPALLGKPEGREFLVQNGQALRMGQWKLIPSAGGGGANRPAANPTGGNPTAATPQANPNTRNNTATPQSQRNNFSGRPWLFHLGNDLSETTDLAAQHPEIVTKMQTELQRIRSTPRTRP